MLILMGLLLVVAAQPLFAASTPLAGTNWVLSTLNGQLPLAGSTLTLNFDEDGAVSGQMAATASQPPTQPAARRSALNPLPRQ
jgi:hypothetical protein